MTPMSYTPQPVPQPLPSYLPPQDPNHPDLSIGFTQSNTIRLAQDSRYRREPSRSPSPGFDDSVRYNYGSGTDVEKALLSDNDRDDLLYGNRTGPTTPAPTAPLSYMSTGAAPDANGDLSLRGMGRLPPIGDRSSIYKAPLDGFESVALVEGQEDPDTTQHFGPAPEGRVGRRPHNAIRKRVKQRVTLDDSDMLSVEMPIPTRLSQFLPVKGVEEQKTTR
jgi:chitin synthase